MKKWINKKVLTAVKKCKAWLYLIASLLLLVVCSDTQAAVYFSRSSGNWNSTTTWSTTGYGGAAALSTPGSAVGDVVLISGYTVTVTATPANAILSLTISQNNNTGNDTKLDLNSAGITLTANSMSVIDNNQNNNIDVSVASTSTLQINGSVSATRSTTNSKDRRLRFYIFNNGRMNVTGNFTFTYGRAKDNESTAYEIQIDNYGRLDVNGNMNITVGNNNGNNNNFEFEMSSLAVCNVGGTLNFTLSNTNDNDQLMLLMNGGTLSVTGTFTNTVASTASGYSTSTVLMYNNARISTGSYTYNYSGNDNSGLHEIELNNTSDFTINGNLTVSYGYNGGGSNSFDFILNNTATCHITGNANLTLQNTNDGDDISMDLNGGALTIDGTCTVTISPTATGGNNLDLKIDGGAMTTGTFTINHNGGSSGDVNIWLNSTSTVNPSSLFVNGNMIMNHTGGDNMYLQTNTNSTLTVTGQLSATLASSSDGDIIYMYFNGGTATVNSLYYDIASGAINSNFLYFTIDGATVSVTNNVTVNHQGGGGSGDVDFWFNRTSTANPSVFNVGGNMVMSHSGGDNMEIELNNNVTVDIGGSLIDTLTSNDGDDFLIDINGGTMTVHQNFNHVQTTLGGTTEDLDVRIDGTGVFNVNGSVNVNQMVGGQVIFYLNNSSGTAARFNVGNDLTVTHGGAAAGVYFETDQGSRITVGGNFTINNNASNGDLARVRMVNTSAITVNGNFTMNLLSGVTSKTDNIEFDMNGGTMTVGKNLIMNGISGKDALITLDGASVLNITDTLFLNHTGGNLTYVYLGNSSGSPVVTMGTLKLLDTGGGQSRFRLWNASQCIVNGNINITAVAATQVDIALYNTSRLKLKGSFIRGASPSRYGILSSASTATVEYIGTANSQTIAGDAGSGGDGFTYGNVILNNTSGIKPAFLMTATEGNATVPSNSNLTFTSGIVSSSASSFFIIANNATVSGANNTSYVDGPIRKVGNQAFTFPIGAADNYQPASISAPANNTHHFTAEYHAADPNSPYNVLSKDPSLNHLSRCEYWIINRTNGASNVMVTLGWDAGSCGVDDLPGLRVARWDGTTWRDNGNSSTTGNNSAGTITTTGSVTSFAATSAFSLSSSNNNNPLPVSLINFNAKRLENWVGLSWSTASEKNNDYFAIERSGDGINFTEIVKIQGAGTSNTMHSYNWNDMHPLSGYSYYRLKQVDFNGDYTYSPVKSIQFIQVIKNSIFSVYPNPSKGESINIKMKDIVNSGNVTANIGVKLIDMNGVSIFSTNNLNVDDAKTGTMKFNTPLHPGVYTVTISTAETIEKQLLVIE